MGLFVAGVNSRRAAFPSISQHLADTSGRRSLMSEVSSHRSLAEGLLMASESRVELYAVVEEGCDAYDIAAGLFGAATDGDVASALYFAEGLDAASHLFAALCSLDEFARAYGDGAEVAPLALLSTDGASVGESSPVPAEALSASWIRAQAEARQAGTLGAELTALAAAVGRLVSALAASGESASAAALGETAVELARRVFGHLERKSVLVLGSGGLGPTLGEAFARAGVDDFTFIGDEAQVAEARAAGVRTATPEALSVVVGNADVVLAGSAVEGVAFDRRLMKGVVRLRRGRPMLLIVGSFRDALIDRRAASFDGVFLYTADDLTAITRDAPWAALGTSDARERLFADAVRAFAIEMI